MMGNKDALTETLLRENFLFKELDDGQLTPFVEIAEKKSILQGERIFSEGDDGDCLCIIADGGVNVIKEEGGREIFVACLGEGSYFGEISLFDEYPRSATVVAAVDTDILTIKKDPFLEILNGDSDIGCKVYRAMVFSISERLRATLGDFAMVMKGNLMKQDEISELKDKS